jgi:hypothetical protein
MVQSTVSMAKAEHQGGLRTIAGDADDGAVGCEVRSSPPAPAWGCWPPPWLVCASRQSRTTSPSLADADPFDGDPPDRRHPGHEQRRRLNRPGGRPAPGHVH